MNMISAPIPRTIIEQLDGGLFPTKEDVIKSNYEFIIAC